MRRCGWCAFVYSLRFFIESEIELTDFSIWFRRLLQSVCALCACVYIHIHTSVCVPGRHYLSSNSCWDSRDRPFSMKFVVALSIIAVFPAFDAT